MSNNISYAWEIKSVDIENRTFIVEYTYKVRSVTLNLPLPCTVEEIDDTINLYAPLQEWLNPQPEKVFSIKEEDKATLVGSMYGRTYSPVIPDQASLDDLFNQKVAKALLQLGVTKSNVYVAPSEVTTP